MKSDNKSKISKLEEEIKIKDLIEQSYTILNGSIKWQKEHRELYSSLEKIVFLGARENVFKDYFERLEKSISSILQLDFSVKAPYMDLTEDKRNLLNYASVGFNMVIEKLEASVVSRKAMNTFLSAFPDTVVIITNEDGYIRFVNNVGEIVLNSNMDDLIGTNIRDLIDKYNLALVKSILENWMSNTQVHVKGRDGQKISFYLCIPEPIEDPSEIKEIVHILRTDPTQGENQKFNVGLETHDKIAPLNQIIGAATQLKEVFGNDEDNLIFAEIIYNNAWSLKEQAQGSLIELVNDLPKEYESINFKSEIENSLWAGHESGGVNFAINIENKLLFFSSPGKIKFLFQSLILNSMKYMRDKPSPKIEIHVKNWDNQGVSIIVKDNGIGISQKDQKRIFENGGGLYIASQLVNKLYGKIEVESKKNAGMTIRIDLPHLS